MVMISLRFFKISNSPSSEVLKLLRNNVIGTPGHGMLYQHLGVDNKIGQITKPYYVNLSRNNHVIGTCCFCSRITFNNEKPIQSFYIRYFSFKDKYRIKQVTTKNRESGNKIIREEVKRLLLGNGLDQKSNDKFFHYAYVDPHNLRSLALCNEFGFEPVRKFSTVIFHRMNPSEDNRIVEITPNEVNSMKETLSNFYRKHTMFSFENLFGIRKYFVIKDDKGKVVAGVSVNPEHWKIHAMPGLSGKIILNTFSALPFLNRIINRDYRFLTFEGIYYQPGCESYLEILFESLLAKYKMNSAMMWIDVDTSLYKILKSLHLGIVNKLNKEVQANVICKFINFNESEKIIFKESPAYISGIDLT